MIHDSTFSLLEMGSVDLEHTHKPVNLMS